MKNSNKFRQFSYPKHRFMPWLLALCMIVGVFGSAAVSFRLLNYDHGWWFAILFGLMGIGVGSYAGYRIKRYINTATSFYAGRISMNVLRFGFMAGFILMASYVNTAISAPLGCIDYTLYDKTDTGETNRSKHITWYTLWLHNDHKAVKLHASKTYYHTIDPGALVPVCYYKSPIGFNFAVLTDE